ncbi:hypothetical protein KSS88_04145 [Bacillus altitudinis]|nr:hypothetical protein [Bacillus altitudinis]MBU8968020.1 hypothetical protein [Bacillus altitudinis]
MSQEIISRIEEVKRNIGENEKKLQDDKTRHKELIATQAKAVKKLLKQMTPILDYMAKNNISFENEELQLHSPIGPIVGFNKDSLELYVIVSGGSITEINLNMEKVTKRNISLEDFLKNYSFEFVYESLLEQLKFQEKQLDRIGEKIKEAETALAKYNLSN